MSEAEDSSQDVEILRAGGDDDQDKIANGQHTSGEKLAPELHAGPQVEEQSEAAEDEEKVAGGSDHRNHTRSGEFAADRSSVVAKGLLIRRGGSQGGPELGFLYPWRCTGTDLLRVPFPPL